MTKPHPQHTTAGQTPAQRSTVAIVHNPNRHPHQAEVTQLVREAMDLIGGMQRFVKPGQTVLIKPNQSVWRLAVDGSSTDPRVVHALALLAKEAGAGKVQVGECSSCGQVTREIMKTTGMTQAAEAAGAEPVYFDEEEPVEVAIPDGRFIHSAPIPRPMLEADVVIACPKLKTHFLDPITGSLKLWVGSVRQDYMHRLHRDNIHETVADLLTVTRPDLAVMDAIIAGEGNGPIATRGKFVGCVLASDDPVALDRIAGDLAGFEHRPMQFPQACAARGIGIEDRTKIDLVGVPLEQVKVHLDPEQVADWDNSYPARILLGEGVTLAGTTGHFKGFADFWKVLHAWEAVVAMHGKPTFMMGRIEDPDFEKHLEEGPYFVIDDAALEKYKRHPKVTFIPGSPVGNEMMPIIMERLGVSLPGQTVQSMIKKWDALRATWTTK